jgi:hypothetical protein
MRYNGHLHSGLSTYDAMCKKQEEECRATQGDYYNRGRSRARIEEYSKARIRTPLVSESAALVQFILDGFSPTRKRARSESEESIEVKKSPSSPFFSYEVDFVVDSRGYNEEQQFLVHWVGYTKEHDKWLYAYELDDVQHEHIFDYWKLTQDQKNFLMCVTNF